MGLVEAWQILERDLDRVLATLAETPLGERGAAMRKICEKARKIATKLAAKNHPDVGGDQVKFRRVWEAYAVVEKYGEEFIEKHRIAMSVPKKKPFIILK